MSVQCCITISPKSKTNLSFMIFSGRVETQQWAKIG